jgi:hypothetical protein
VLSTNKSFYQIYFNVSGPPPPYTAPFPNQQPPPTQPLNTNNMYGGSDMGGAFNDGAFSFSEKSIRMAFIRFVAS